MDAPPTWRILLVDDSEHDRRIARRILERADPAYVIEEADGGPAALERLERENFDLLIVDLKMPGMDGIELLGRAQNLLCDAAVIILSGTESAPAAREALRLGVTDYLLKEPATALESQLADRVANVLRQVQLLRTNRRLEREVRLRAAFLEQIQAQLPEAVFATIGPDRTLSEINAAGRSLLGLAPEENPAARPIGEALRRLSPELAAAVDQALAEGRPIGNLYVESADEAGEGRLWLVSLRPVETEAEDEAPAPWVLTVRDATPPSRAPGAEEMIVPGLIGRDPAILELGRLIRQVAPMPTSVLVIGPTGSGKEVVARGIHALSERASRPFVAVNCTALSGEILESELFGHVRGAFTGAVAPRKGRFREADGGTLFLDEIGDTTESFQAKLLRVLETGELEPVGQDRPVKIDVRLICATNRDLPRAVEEGRFRRDLYYRINVVRLDVPPLRDRIGDLPLLVEAIRREFNRRFHKSIRQVSHDAMRVLAGHDWPGNVRELRHALEHAFVVAEGPTITRADLPGWLYREPRPRPSLSAAPIESSVRPSLAAPSEQGEAETLRRALDQSGGNIGQAARLLGIHRTTLWRKMRQFGVEARPRPGADTPAGGPPPPAP